MSHLVDQLLGCLPGVRDAFFRAGFLLPRQYLAAIEATRQRASDECDYQYYLDEVLREYAALPYPWQPAVRNLLGAEDRSPYLDWLAARCEDKALSLDPNFDLFLKERLQVDVRQAQVSRFRMEKDKELDRHIEELGGEIGNTFTALVARIFRTAEEHGFQSLRPFGPRDKSLEFVFSRGSPPRISLKVLDLVALRKHGYVVVQCFFDELPGKPFGIDNFLAGGGLYSDWNENPKAVLYSFFVQCKFMSRLGAELASHD